MALPRYRLIIIFLASAFLTGCGSNDSSTGSASDEECGSVSRGWCQGTYSSGSSDKAEWTGVCEVRQIDSGEWAYLWFHTGANCGFEWVRAKGSTGSDWVTLASGAVNEKGHPDKQFMILHTGEKVFQLRRCVDGSTADKTECL